MARGVEKVFGVMNDSKHKLKIVFFPNDCALISGSSQSMYQLILELMDMNLVDPYIIFPYKGDGIQFCERYGIAYDIVRSWGWCTPIRPKNFLLQNIKDMIKFFLNIISVLRINLKLRQLKPDIIHNNTSYCYVGPCASYNLELPVVWQLREGQLEQDNKMWIECVCCNVMAKADRLMVISNDLLTVWKDRIRKGSFEVVYNGISVSKYYSLRNIFESHEVNILCIGSITKKKGQDQTIRALGRLKQQIPFLKLNIVGKGADEESFKELACNVGVQDRVRFCGQSTNPMDYYQKTDIFVCNSFREAFGRVTVEAMMAGCLVIASDSGANSEILERGKYGLLYKYGDIDDLVNKIKYAVAHKDEMRILARNGQKHAINRYNSLNNAQNIYKVYDEVMKHNGGRKLV